MSRTWYIVDRILLERRVVAWIERDGDDWFVFDGAEWDIADIVAIDEAELLKYDPTIGEVLDLEDGFEAVRNDIQSPWTRQPSE